jgi:hypothetical protein
MRSCTKARSGAAGRVIMLKAGPDFPSSHKPAAQSQAPSGDSKAKVCLLPAGPCHSYQAEIGMMQRRFSRQAGAQGPSSLSSRALLTEGLKSRSKPQRIRDAEGDAAAA